MIKFAALNYAIEWLIIHKLIRFLATLRAEEFLRGIINHKMQIAFRWLERARLERKKFWSNKKLFSSSPPRKENYSMCLDVVTQKYNKIKRYTWICVSAPLRWSLTVRKTWQDFLFPIRNEWKSLFVLSCFLFALRLLQFERGKLLYISVRFPFGLLIGMKRESHKNSIFYGSMNF